VNSFAKGAKYAGRVFVIVLLAVEFQKIRTADDWRRQLGSSSSGVLGTVGGGILGGASTGFVTGSRSLNPWITAGATIIGGIAGGAIGYEVASGLFEHIYDVYLLD
jgi:outer membrane lipoprotein SlyB